MKERLEKQKLEYELQLKKLKLEQLRSGHPGFNLNVSFDVTKLIRLVPPFQEQDVDKYFLHFEKVAENLKWPKENWPLLLQSILISKAREIYPQLSVEQALNYDSIKELILQEHELVLEAYCQKFHTCEKESNKMYVEFSQTKEQLFDRCCAAEKNWQNP